jgi:hypothetical protein
MRVLCSPIAPEDKKKTKLHFYLMFSKEKATWRPNLAAENSTPQYYSNDIWKNQGSLFEDFMLRRCTT